MPACPHCGQEIGPIQPASVPWWKLDLSSQGVNLGCGSLILIALIVAICSGGGGLSSRIERLDASIQQLENRVDQLDKAIDKLTKKP